MTAQRWIPVTEALPPPGSWVVVWQPATRDPWERGRQLAEFEDGEFSGEYVETGDVTHWLPIPDPPETHPLLVPPADDSDEPLFLVISRHGPDGKWEEVARYGPAAEDAPEDRSWAVAMIERLPDPPEAPQEGGEG
jgi:hypothetical protein